VVAVAVSTSVRFEARGAALEVLRRRDPEMLLSGPAGTGKSMACLYKLHAVALSNPGMRGLILRKTLASLGSTALVTWREKVVKEALETGLVTFYGGSAEEPPQYRYTNGSVVVIGGLDRATRIMSSEYDMIYVQEAVELTETDWESVTTRLRNHVVSFQQLIADTNPGAPTHWLKARCDRGATFMLYSKHEDNPMICRPDGSLTASGALYIARLDGLTGVRKERLRHGRWVAAEGVIYEDWSEAAHLLPVGWRPEPDWTRYLAVDFGFTNPFVAQWWAEDGDGRLYLYREIYETGRTVDQHAATIKRLSGDERPQAIVCDHDAEGRAVLGRELGRATRAADKRVSVGIQAVQQRLRPAEDGRPRLFVVRGALAHAPDPVLQDAKRPTCTLDEIPAYVWDVTDGRPPKEAPRKEDDHGCDAMRYMVMYRARPGVRGARFI
jgi:hypothetical protein